MDAHGYETHPSLTRRGSYGVGSSVEDLFPDTLWREKWPAHAKDPFTHAASRAACAGPMLSADGRALLD